MKKLLYHFAYWLACQTSTPKFAGLLFTETEVKFKYSSLVPADDQWHMVSFTFSSYLKKPFPEADAEVKTTVFGAQVVTVPNNKPYMATDTVDVKNDPQPTPAIHPEEPVSIDLSDPHAAKKYYGREVTKAVLADDVLRIDFTDGTHFRLYDDGQSCCESRYMTTDDDPASLVGQTIVSIECRDGGHGGSDDNGEYREEEFVIIQGNKSAITLCTHNDNNGYYGGFDMKIDEGSTLKA